MEQKITTLKSKLIEDNKCQNKSNNDLDKLAESFEKLNTICDEKNKSLILISEEKLNQNKILKMEMNKKNKELIEKENEILNLKEKIENFEKSIKGKIEEKKNFYDKFKELEKKSLMLAEENEKLQKGFEEKSSELKIWKSKFLEKEQEFLNESKNLKNKYQDTIIKRIVNLIIFIHFY